MSLEKLKVWFAKRKIKKLENSVAKEEEQLKTYFYDISDIWKDLDLDKRKRKVLKYFINNCGGWVSRKKLHKKFEKLLGFSRTPLDKFLEKLTRKKISGILTKEGVEDLERLCEREANWSLLEEIRVFEFNSSKGKWEEKKFKNLKDKINTLKKAKWAIIKLPLLKREEKQGKYNPEYFYTLSYPVYFDNRSFNRCRKSLRKWFNRLF
jgi:hypothetical protein